MELLMYDPVGAGCRIPCRYQPSSWTTVLETEYHINRIEKAGVKLVNILVVPACCKRGIMQRRFGGITRLSRGYKDAQIEASSTKNEEGAQNVNSWRRERISKQIRTSRKRSTLCTFGRKVKPMEVSCPGKQRHPESLAAICEDRYYSVS
jgi:hypothetical protein